MTYRSPYARKVRVALLEKQIAFDEINVNLADKPKELLATNPLGSVPSLLINKDLSLYDSTEILLYLEENFGSPLLPTTDKWKALNWEELSDRLCDGYVKLFHDRQDKVDTTRTLEKCGNLAKIIMPLLERELAEKPFLTGAFSLADIAFGTTLGWIDFRLGEKLSGDYPKVTAWLKTLEARPSFVKTYPKLD